MDPSALVNEGSGSRPESMPWYVIDPSSYAKLWWDVWAVLILVYVVVIAPMRLAFMVEDHCPSFMWLLEAIIDVCFVVDLFLNFFTAVYVSDSNMGTTLKTDLRTIACVYLRSWFLIDIVSSAPIDLVLTLYLTGCRPPQQNYLENSGSSVGSITKLVRSLRIVKLLKVAVVDGTPMGPSRTGPRPLRTHSRHPHGRHERHGR